MDGALVLIVDDDPALLQALPEALKLRMADLTVHTCGSAADALARIAEVDYDVVVTDIKMPGMDGLELLAEVRARRPDTPTLMITGHGEHDLAVRALRGGAYDFIQKPIDRDYVVASLNRAIQVRQLSRRVRDQQLALERHAAELERTVEERTRELREASRAKEEFLAVLSHEMRAPLTPIMIWSEILKRAADSRVRHAAEVMERNVRLEATLVDDLLDVTRITTGKLALDSRSHDLREIIRSAIESITEPAWDKGIRIAHTAPAEPVPVECDAGRLHQVFANLLWNAVKFTPRNGRVTVRVTVQNDAAVVSVRDSGEGIAPEFLPFVFDMFRQAEEGTRRQHEGPGVGLAIAKHLVELHGGTIQAASEGPGRGSEFTVRLPLTAGADRRASLMDGDPGRPLPRLDGLVVLLVEDMADTSEATVAMLETLGAQVTVANDGLEALNKLARLDPDIILCDLRLPVMDGFEFVRRIRSDPGRAHLPVVAVSALAKAADYRQSREAGFDAHLSKPFDYAALASALNSVRNAPFERKAS
jgi:two-component system sensor histidine kinase/response regulator